VFHIPSLDGLRAFAVGVVFLAHVGLKTLVPGEFGVTVFFFLSGFLITTLLRIEHARTAAISLRDFYLRRVLRIFPPFYLVLVGATALAALGPLSDPHLRLEPGQIAAQALYLTNYNIIATNWWDGRAPGTWIYWSLAVEEHFYLFFPLLYLLLLRFLPERRRQLAVLLGLCALVLAWRTFLVYGLHAPKERTYIASDTRIDSILFGCALAVFGNPVLDRTRFSDAQWKFVWLPLGLAGLLISFLIRNPALQQSVRYSLQGLALVPIFVCAMRFRDWFAFRALNWRPVAFVGVLSYTLYLVHPTVIFGLDKDLTLPGGVLVGLVSLAIAVAMYYVVERPAARLRRRLSHLTAARRPRPAPLAVGVAAADR
jgi:peptidoglycan/LPS O-acetylase OafA/YrhL